MTSCMCLGQMPRSEEDTNEQKKTKKDTSQARSEAFLRCTGIRIPCRPHPHRHPNHLQRLLLLDDAVIDDLDEVVMGRVLPRQCSLLDLAWRVGQFVSGSL
jgi:hypothetical protein